MTWSWSPKSLGISETSGALSAPVPPVRRQEPLIVTLSRRYARRGASLELLRRLAGGEGNWRWLRDTWEIEGPHVAEEERAT